MSTHGPSHSGLPISWRDSTGIKPDRRTLPPEYRRPAPDLVDPPRGLGKTELPDTPQPQTKRAKDLSIETLRGVAIILMVMGHVISARPEGGLQVSDDSWWRYFYLTFSPMRMPLFTVISGYVYAMRPVQWESSKVFLTGKARRLLLPMASVATVQYLFTVFSPGVTNPQPVTGIWRIYFFGFDQFWFLQSIALVFVTVYAMEILGMLEKRRGWVTCMAIGSLIFLFGPTETKFFSIDGWCKLLVFFILGLGLYRFDVLSKGRGPFIAAAALLAIAATLHQLYLFDKLDPGSALPWIVLGCGLGATFLLVRLRFTYKPIAWLGGYAFTIYLLHAFGVTGARILSKNILGITNTEALFIICLTLGLALPVLGHLVLERHKITRRVFLGLR